MLRLELGLVYATVFGVVLVYVSIGICCLRLLLLFSVLSASIVGVCEATGRALIAEPIVDIVGVVCCRIVAHTIVVGVIRCVAYTVTGSMIRADL